MKPFDKSFEAKSIFLDISQAFDKVWHNCIIFKLTQNGILKNLLNLLLSFLKEKNCEVFIEQVFIWPNINVKLPPGSNFGPLLSLTSINNLTVGLSTNAKIFADDPPFVSNMHDTSTSSNFLNKDLEITNIWAFPRKRNFNPDHLQKSSLVGK